MRRRAFVVTVTLTTLWRGLQAGGTLFGLLVVLPARARMALNQLAFVTALAALVSH